MLPNESPVLDGPPDPPNKDPANFPVPPLPPSAGEQPGMAGDNLAATIAEIRRSERRIIKAKKIQQQLLRTIVPSNVTLFAVDRNRKVTMLEGGLVCDSQVRNPGWYIGEDVYDVFNRLDSSLPEGQDPPFLEPLQSVLAGESVSDFQRHEIHGRWYRTQFHPLVRHITRGEATADTGVDGAVGLLVDISVGPYDDHIEAPTARHAVQPDANNVLATDVTESNKQFLAVMSHDIRTPVVGVISMAELLLADDDLRDAQRTLAGNIYRSAKALLALINDILDFSQTDSGTLDVETIPFYPLPIIRDITEGLNHCAKLKGLEFFAHIAADVDSDFKVMGDPGRLRHVLTSLLSNSFDVDQLFDNPDYVDFSVRKGRETPQTITLEFVIHDTRRADQDLVQVLHGNSPTTKRVGRTQRGLSICKSVVEMMNGRIRLDSMPGGTTTIIGIPFEKTPCQRASGSGQTSLSASLTERSRSAWRNSSTDDLLATIKPAEKLPFSQRGSILILIAEDNPINQQFALLAIKKLGFQAVAVNDGQETLFYLTAAMEGKKTKPRVIILDIQMPIVDGYMCACILRNDQPFKDYVNDVPIVALTASAIQGDKEKCKSAGMDDYLSKPISVNVLERVLVRWSTQSRLGASSSDPDASDGSDTSKNGDCDTPEEDSDEEGQGSRLGASAPTLDASVSSETGKDDGEGDTPKDNSGEEGWQLVTCDEWR